MAEKKKKSSWGGQRSGAGRKSDGIETAVIHHRVPVQYYSLIKELIKSRLKELKENSNTEIKTAPTCMEAAKKISQSPSFKKAFKEISPYLAKRRQNKLGS